ncbi:hypothetical protein C5167_025731 [Papaver somniferum]|uniref:Uncharacterized protein n=1 Tax=Papaver somniferum TaxID=3469 RepID=A0A4Y7JTW3_PAPSO|nr:hypothetical protein C5167_025731 [Papaver somniferum]
MLTDCKQPLLQLQPRQLPKILISSTTFKPSLSRTYRPISLRCESQILKPLTSVLSKQGEIFSSTSTIWSNQMEFFKAASTVIGVFGPVFSVVSALYSLAVVYKGGDLIELPINGVVTIGYVHSIGVFNTNVQLQSGGGWYKIKHFNGDIKTVCNLTRVDGALKFYRIYVDFEIDKNSPLKEIKQKIKDIISKEEYVQDLSVSLLTEKKILLAPICQGSSGVKAFCWRLIWQLLLQADNGFAEACSTDAALAIGRHARFHFAGL